MNLLVVKDGEKVCHGADGMLSVGNTIYVSERRPDGTTEYRDFIKTTLKVMGEKNKYLREKAPTLYPSENVTSAIRANDENSFLKGLNWIRDNAGINLRVFQRARINRMNAILKAQQRKYGLDKDLTSERIDELHSLKYFVQRDPLGAIRQAGLLRSKWNVEDVGFAYYREIDDSDDKLSISEDTLEKVGDNTGNYINPEVGPRHFLKSIATSDVQTNLETAKLLSGDFSKFEAVPNWKEKAGNCVASAYSMMADKYFNGNQILKGYGEGLGEGVANELAVLQGFIALATGVAEDIMWVPDADRSSSELMQGSVEHFREYFKDAKGDGLRTWGAVSAIAGPTLLLILKAPALFRAFPQLSSVLGLSIGMRGMQQAYDNHWFVQKNEYGELTVNLERLTNAAIMVVHGALMTIMPALGVTRDAGLTYSLLVNNATGKLRTFGRILVGIVAAYRFHKAGNDMMTCIDELGSGNYEINETKGLAQFNLVVNVLHMCLSVAALVGVLENPTLSSNTFSAKITNGFAGGIGVTPKLIVGSRYITNPVFEAMQKTGALNDLVAWGSQGAYDHNANWAKLLFAQHFGTFVEQVTETSRQLELGGLDSMSYTAVYGSVFRLLSGVTVRGKAIITDNVVFKALGFDLGKNYGMVNGLLDEIFRENFWSAFVFEPGLTEGFAGRDYLACSPALANAIAEQLSEIVSGAGEGADSDNSFNGQNDPTKNMNAIDRALDKAWNWGKIVDMKIDDGIEEAATSGALNGNNDTGSENGERIEITAGSLAITAGALALNFAIFNPTTMGALSNAINSVMPSLSATISGSEIATFVKGLCSILGAGVILKNTPLNMNVKDIAKALTGGGTKISNADQKTMTGIEEKMPKAPKAGKIGEILQKQGIAEPRQELVNLLALQNKSLDNGIELKEAYLKLQRKSGFVDMGVIKGSVKPDAGIQATTETVIGALTAQEIDGTVIEEVAEPIAKRVDESRKGRLTKGQEITFELGDEAISYEVKEEGLTLMDVVEELVAENRLPEAASKSLKSKFPDGVVPYEVSYEVQKHKDGSIKVKYSNRSGLMFEENGNLIGMNCTESFSHDDIAKYQSGEIEVIARGHTEPVKSAAGTRDMFAMNVRARSVYGYFLPEIIFEKTGEGLINTKILRESDVTKSGLTAIAEAIQKAINACKPVKIDGIEVEGTSEAVNLTVKTVVSEGGAAVDIADFEEGLRKALMEEGILPPLPDVLKPGMSPVGAGGFALPPETMNKMGSQDAAAYAMVKRKMESQGMVGNIYLVLPIESICDVSGNIKPNTGLKDMTKGFKNTNVYVIVNNKTDETRFEKVKEAMNLTEAQSDRFNPVMDIGEVNTQSVMSAIGIDAPEYLAIGMIDSPEARRSIRTDLTERGIESASFLIEGDNASYSANASVIAVLARIATSQVAILANGFEGPQYNDISSYLQTLQTKLQGIMKYMVIRAGEFMERMQEFISQVAETQVAL
ncbi:hypothetical protein ACFL3J_00780 [Candidatus Omnitrophota bacterium]